MRDTMNEQSKYRKFEFNCQLFCRYVVLVLLDESDSNAYLGECHIDLENFQVEVGFEGSFELSDMVSATS